jgi:uncharacterized membrane protein
MGGADEIIFHQLLQWHNFYLDTTQFGRIFSDGLLHTFTTAMWFAGALLVFYRRRRLSRTLESGVLWAGVLVGMGGFQIFDGVVNHKILQLHPVRAGVENIWPYDAAWVAAGLLLLGASWFLRRIVTREHESVDGQ